MYADNTYIYIGGSFTSIGVTTANITVNGITRYKISNSSFNTLGSGFATGSVYAICGDGTYIYACGAFSVSGTTTVNNIARWNGTTWEAMGNGTSGIIYDMKFINNDLYVVGSFNKVDGTINTSKIARWNTTDQKWYAVGTSETFNDYIKTFDIYNDEIYVGGNFTSIGTLNTRIAKFNGTSWSNVPNLSNLIDNRINKIYIKNNILYVGGYFTNYIYKYRLS